MAAILFFVLCGVGASAILAAASASAGKMLQVPKADQKRFAVESAAAFLRDELKSKKTAIKIRDVKVTDSREENPEYFPVEYTYADGTALKPERILDACIMQMYRSLEEEDKNTEKEETSRQQFTFSVQTSKTRGTNTQTVELEQLQTSIDLTMNPDYGITALISDMQTDENHPEDLCQRKMTVSAKTHEDETVDTEDHEETDENGNVTEEWSIVTTTRITTIYWERGVIEKVHPDTEAEEVGL